MLKDIGADNILIVIKRKNIKLDIRIINCLINIV